MKGVWQFLAKLNMREPYDSSCGKRGLLFLIAVASLVAEHGL